MMKPDLKTRMTVLCTTVILSAAFMLAVGGLALWPARDLEKSIESDREFLGKLSAGKVTCSDEDLSRYASDILEYDRALKGGYLAMARVFFAWGGIFLILGAWQLILIRKLSLGRAQPDGN